MSIERAGSWQLGLMSGAMTVAELLTFVDADRCLARTSGLAA